MPLLPHLGWAKPWVIILTATLPGHVENDHPFWTLTCHNRACVDEVLQAAEPSPAVTRIQVFKPGGHSREQGQSEDRGCLDRSTCYPGAAPAVACTAVRRGRYLVFARCTASAGALAAFCAYRFPESDGGQG
jgi:hypothetical protein